MVITTDILLYILIAMLVIVVLWLIKIEIRLNRIFSGKKAKDLEDVILDTKTQLKKLNVSKNEIEEYLETVEKRLRESVQGISTVRFNPFKDSGSNQSFATAFINQKGNGVVISSLYSRERVSIFAKPITNGASTYELTDEEKKAVKEASIAK